MKIVRALFGLCLLLNIGISSVMVKWWIEDFTATGEFSDMYPALTAMCCWFAAIDIGGIVKAKKLGRKVLATTFNMKFCAFIVVMGVDFLMTGDPGAGVGFIILGVFIFGVSVIVNHSVKHTAISAYSAVNAERRGFGGFKAEWLWEDISEEYCRLNGTEVDAFNEEDDDLVYYYGCVCIAYLYTWLVKHDHIEEMMHDGISTCDEVRYEKTDPARFIYLNCDASLYPDDVKEDMYKFLDDYCNDMLNEYQADFEELVVCGSDVKWCRDFSWDTYREFEKRIDERYQNYLINTEFENDFYTDDFEYYDGKEPFYSHTLAQEVTVDASKEVTDDYVEKCKAVCDYMSVKLLWQIEEIINREFSEFLFVDEDDGGEDKRYTSDMFIKGASQFGIVIPKPYGSDPAFILSCLCDFEPDYGIALIIRGSKVLDVKFRHELRTPWGYMSTENDNKI